MAAIAPIRMKSILASPSALRKARCLEAEVASFLRRHRKKQGVLPALGLIQAAGTGQLSVNASRGIFPALGI